MMGMFQRAVMFFVPLVLSLTVHEFAHAWSAKKLGDNTAEMQGRLTLNPVVHADLFGTVLLPIILAVTGAPFGFGWAKPVPVNPQRFTRTVTMRTGMLIVAAAGPLSNLAMAVLFAVFFSVLVHAGVITTVPEGLLVLVYVLVSMNIALFVFNMIPVYPLDGQKVLAGLLKYEAAIRFERFSAQYGSWMLILLFVFASRLIGPPIELIRDGLFTLVGLR